MAVCKICGKQIKWVHTDIGKAIPCEPTKIFFRQMSCASGTIITERGSIIKNVLYEDDPSRATSYGYRPHFDEAGKLLDYYNRKGQCNYVR